MHPLVSLAKETIHSIYSTQKIVIPQGFTEQQGCFVTITKQGKLRGCIGYITTDKPLVDTVQEAAKAAALHDPRFPPLEEEELAQITIEVSVLTRPQKIRSSSPSERAAAFNPGTTGLIVQRGWKSGLLLPQVFDENTTGIEALTMTSEKAGLPKNAWKEPETSVYVFSAIVYNEDS
jgi:AmmeMemoRadiSam system protein A